MSRHKQLLQVRETQVLAASSLSDQAAAASRLYQAERAVAARAGGMYYLPNDDAPAYGKARGWTLHERTAFNRPSPAGRVAPAPACA